MTREAAYQALHNSGRRHDRNIAADQPGSKVKLFAPKLLATYESACRRMRDFIKEAAKAEQRLGRLVEALGLIMGEKQFRVLLASEGLATMPKLLAQRMQGATFEPSAVLLSSEIPSSRNENRQLAGGICPEVLDVLQDYPVKAKIFGLLRHVLPIRQLEIARLMVAMDRVTFTYAKMLIALTPPALLDKGFHPATIANLSQDQYSLMEPELSRLSVAFLSAVEQRGLVSLELVAASRYFERLMDNSRVVRYLAHGFPGHFEEFHNLSVLNLK